MTSQERVQHCFNKKFHEVKSSAIAASSPSFPLNLKIDPTDTTLSWESIPWVPEAFHARFPVSVSGFAVRVFGQRPKTCRPAADEAPRRAREKNLWYPG